MAKLSFVKTMEHWSEIPSVHDSDFRSRVNFGDGHLPLNLTVNYYDQLTNQNAIYSRYKSL